MVFVEDELGIVPGLHNLLRRLRGFLAKRGLGSGAQEDRPLDPMVVDNEAWRAMRRSVRRWPDYREAPNSFAIRVSEADWSEYWGVDTDRKAASVARYLLRQAADKDLWIAGTPQVSFAETDEVARGDVAVSAGFAQAHARAHKVTSEDLEEVDTADAVDAAEAGIAPAASYERDRREDRRRKASHGRREAAASEPARIDPDATARFDRLVVHPGPGEATSAENTVLVRSGRRGMVPEDDWARSLAGASPDETVVLPRATTFAGDASDLDATQPQAKVAVDSTDADETKLVEPAEATDAGAPADDETDVLPLDVPSSAYLVDDGGFRMIVHPGDVIGAVGEGVAAAPDVNIRLDGRGFPGVEPRHLSLAATASGWTVTDLAEAGTQIDSASGETRVLGPDEVAALSEGDVIHLGAKRPLRFQF